MQKNRITADFLRNLPDGVTHMERREGEEAKDPEDEVFENLDDDVKEGDIVKCGDFLINIEKVSKT